MHLTLSALLLCLAACGARSQDQTAQPSPAPNTNVAGTGCGAAPGNATGNEIDGEGMCLPEMTASERRQAEARARGGDVEAMLALAGNSGPAEARRWYMAAAARGSCHAVRTLDATAQYEGSAAERRRWSAEDRRLGCSVPRWTANADGSLVYAEPDNFLWVMWIGCVDHRIRITGGAGSTPSETPRFTFRTTGGDQPRAISSTTAGGWAVLAFDAGPGDEVLAALVRGERIEMFYSLQGTPIAIDAGGLRERLPALVQRCFGGS